MNVKTNKFFDRHVSSSNKNETFYSATTEKCKQGLQLSDALGNFNKTQYIAGFKTKIQPGYRKKSSKT